MANRVVKTAHHNGAKRNPSEFNLKIPQKLISGKNSALSNRGEKINCPTRHSNSSLHNYLQKSEAKFLDKQLEKKSRLLSSHLCRKPVNVVI